MRLDTPSVRDLGRTQPIANQERHRVASRSSLPGLQPLSDSVAVAVDIGTLPLAIEPAFDPSRVAAIQAAIRDGTYPLQPARTASAMIAAKPLLSIGR